MANDNIDTFYMLKECSWRGIAFPISSISTEVTQDIAVHSPMYSKGPGFVESTGKGNSVFTVQAVFSNTIAKGRHETWNNNLFPGVYSQLLKSINDDKSIGIFSHPFLGDIFCRAVKLSEEFNAQNRGGPIVQIQFIETSQTEAGVDKFYISGRDMQMEAKRFDDLLDELYPPVDTGLDLLGFDSYTDFATQLAQFQGSLELFQSKIFNKIGQVVESVNKVSRTIERNATMLTELPENIGYQISTVGPAVVKLKDAGYSFIEAISQAQLISENVTSGKDGLAFNYKVEKYKVLEDSSIVQLVQRTKNKISELMKLNPGIMDELIIKKDTIINAYQRFQDTTTPAFDRFSKDWNNTNPDTWRK